MSRIYRAQKNISLLSIALTVLLVPGILSGCTQVSRPVNESTQPPSTGKAMVREKNEATKQAIQAKTMAEQMNQCQDMMKRSLNNPNVTYDKQYIDTMIQHHQGSIQMAQDAKQKAQHAEVRQLAESIIETEQKEIQKLKDWRQKWYGTESQKSAQQQ